jgi:hypothetical protein
MDVLTLTLLIWAFYGQKNPAVKRDSELCWMLLYYKLVVEHGTEPASVIRITVRPQVSSPGFGLFGRFRGHSSELEQPRRAGFEVPYWLPVGTRTCGMDRAKY